MPTPLKPIAALTLFFAGLSCFGFVLTAEELTTNTTVYVIVNATGVAAAILGALPYLWKLTEMTLWWGMLNSGIALLAFAGAAVYGIMETYDVEDAQSAPTNTTAAVETSSGTSVAVPDLHLAFYFAAWITAVLLSLIHI